MNIRDAGYLRVVDIEGNTISQQDIKSIKNLFREKDSKQRIGINLKQVNYPYPTSIHAADASHPQPDCYRDARTSYRR